MTDQRKVAELNAILDKPKRTAELPPASNAPALKSARGYAGTPQAKGGGGGGGGGGGIESPLTEGPYAGREYYESSYFLSTDLLMAIELKPLKRISMTDAAGNDVVLDFAEPI